MSAVEIARPDSPGRAALARHLVWDNHVCLPLRPNDSSFVGDLARYRAVGVDVVMVNVGFGEHSVDEHIRMLASFRDWLARNANHYRVIDTLADIEAARTAGQLAVGFDIEGASAIDDQLSLIRLYHRLGVRWMLLAYNRPNRAGGGCQAPDDGLSDFGRSMLVEMADVGMVACCSHTGYRTAREAIDASPAPVIFSHSNPLAMQVHPRNIPNSLIRACAARGGVVGINGIGVFLGEHGTAPQAVARHAAYVAELVGVAHVGFGLDYVVATQELNGYVTAHPEMFPPELGYAAGMKMLAPEQVPELADALLEHGFSDADLGAMLGGNWLRIARQVWKD